MTQDELKQAVARAARDYVADRLPVGAILGVSGRIAGSEDAGAEEGG